MAINKNVTRITEKQILLLLLLLLYVSFATASTVANSYRTVSLKSKKPKKSLSEMQRAPKFSVEELQEMRQDLAATVYNRATTQLLIYQRGLRLNATTFDHDRAATTIPESRKSSLRKVKGYVQDNETKNMPSEKLLNEIKLEKELTTLRRIYAVAYEELMKDEIDRMVKDKRNEKNDIDKNDQNNEKQHKQKVNQSTKIFGTYTRQENDKKDTDDFKVSQYDKKDIAEKDKKDIGANAIFHAAVEAQKEDNNEEEQLLLELRHNQATLKSLRVQIDTEYSDGAERMIAKEERIATLRHNLRNVRSVNDLEVDLVQRWEENRFTQATIIGENDERALLQQILALKQRLGGEQRIICEVQNFNAKQFSELRTKIGEWKRKYADELARKQAATLAHELRIAEVSKSHERHRQTYEERVVFVSEYLAAKAEELRLFEAQMHRVECAVRIQAWWRGVMVRRGLGPYRKKSKKGKKGKGKTK